MVGSNPHYNLEDVGTVGVPLCFESRGLLRGSGFDSSFFRQEVNTMTEDELIEAARNRPVTEADIKAFEQRLRDTEEEFGDMSGRVSNEWLNREYGGR